MPSEIGLGSMRWAPLSPEAGRDLDIGAQLATSIVQDSSRQLINFRPIVGNFTFLHARLFFF